MRFALSTGSLYTYGTERVFALAAEVGFDGLEVLIDERFDTRQAGYLRRMAERHGRPILSVHAPFWPERVSYWPSSQPHSVIAAAELARDLGAEVVVVHLPRRWEKDFERWLLQELPIWQEEHPHPKIGLENMPRKRFTRWFIPLNYWRMNTLEEWGQFEHLTLDTTHLGTKGLDVLGTYQRLRERVVHVHLSNARRKGQRVLEHRRLEDGFLPLDAFLQQLERDDYRGVVTVELHPAALEANDEDRVRRHLQRQLAFCRQHGRAE